MPNGFFQRPSPARSNGSLHYSDRGVIDRLDTVPEKAARPALCHQNLFQREEGEPFGTVRGVGPGVSNLNVVAGHEGKPPVPRGEGGVVNQPLAKINAYGAALAVRENKQKIEEPSEEKTELSSQIWQTLRPGPSN
jgi:hypothetical protein